MRHLLNTLYVTTQGAYLSKERETVLVRVEGETKLRLPIHTIGSIVCFGRVSCSPTLIGFCGVQNVPISLLSRNGKFLARINGPVSGNVLLRREQYRRADDQEACAILARSMIIAKIANSKSVLMRFTRDHSGYPNYEELKTAARKLARLLAKLKRSLPIDEVRGAEGEAARVYFDVFDHLITAQKESFFFRGRNRRPPLDNMNALLSFLYTLLVHDIQSALEGVGLDPAVGFLHRDRPGRPGLALDLMEEFRPLLADRLALSLVNRQQVKGKGFTMSESGAVLMNERTRKEVLVSYQKRKQEEIRHPFLGEKLPVGLLPHVQALILARSLRGDINGYPPMIWK